MAITQSTPSNQAAVQAQLAYANVLNTESASQALAYARSLYSPVSTPTGQAIIGPGGQVVWQSPTSVQISPMSVPSSGGSAFSSGTQSIPGQTLVPAVGRGYIPSSLSTTQQQAQTSFTGSVQASYLNVPTSTTYLYQGVPVATLTPQDVSGAGFTVRDVGIQNYEYSGKPNAKYTFQTPTKAGLQTATFSPTQATILTQVPTSQPTAIISEITGTISPLKNPYLFPKFDIAVENILGKAGFIGDLGIVTLDLGESFIKGYLDIGIKAGSLFHEAVLNKQGISYKVGQFPQFYNPNIPLTEDPNVQNALIATALIVAPPIASTISPTFGTIVGAAENLGIKGFAGYQFAKNPNVYSGAGVVLSFAPELIKTGKLATNLVRDSLNVPDYVIGKGATQTSLEGSFYEPNTIRISTPESSVYKQLDILPSSKISDITLKQFQSSEAVSRALEQGTRARAVQDILAKSRDILANDIQRQSLQNFKDYLQANKLPIQYDIDTSAIKDSLNYQMKRLVSGEDFISIDKEGNVIIKEAPVQPKPIEPLKIDLDYADIKNKLAYEQARLKRGEDIIQINKNGELEIKEAPSLKQPEQLAEITDIQKASLKALEEAQKVESNIIKPKLAKKILTIKDFQEPDISQGDKTIESRNQGQKLVAKQILEEPKAIQEELGKIRQVQFQKLKGILKSQQQGLGLNIFAQLEKTSMLNRFGDIQKSALSDKELNRLLSLSAFGQQARQGVGLGLAQPSNQAYATAQRYIFAQSDFIAQAQLQRLAQPQPSKQNQQEIETFIYGEQKKLGRPALTFPVKQMKQVRISRKQLYNVAVRRKGQFEPIATDLSESGAILFGERSITRSLQRTFKVSRGREIETADINIMNDINIKPIPQFREYKVRKGKAITTPSQFILKTKYLLQTPEQKILIQQAKREAKMFGF